MNLKHLFIPLIFLILSCGGKDTEPEQHTVTNFLSKEEGLSYIKGTDGPWELGFVFSPSRNGKLTQLGCKMPEAGYYRVTLWDFESKEILLQNNVNQNFNDSLKLENVVVQNLKAPQKYILSVNTFSSGRARQYFDFYKDGGGDFMPFKKGDIEILNTCFIPTAETIFPSWEARHRIYGIPEFTFIAD